MVFNMRADDHRISYMRYAAAYAELYMRSSFKYFLFCAKYLRDIYNKLVKYFSFILNIARRDVI
jgi:hypothetical protein